MHDQCKSYNSLKQGNKMGAFCKMVKLAWGGYFTKGSNPSCCNNGLFVTCKYWLCETLTNCQHTKNYMSSSQHDSTMCSHCKSELNNSVTSRFTHTIHTMLMHSKYIKVWNTTKQAIPTKKKCFSKVYFEYVKRFFFILMEVKNIVAV